MIEQLAEEVWYGRRPISYLLRALLAPLSLLYCLLVAVRRLGYRSGLLYSRRVSLPVIVVGNITVGGTGKTPLVIALIRLLQQQGFRPAVLSRGYGREDEQKTLRVDIDGSPAESGDEPLLIARESSVPVYVAADRIAAAEQAILDRECDILISDDGLQHYQLQRNIEIAVIDGERQLGNRLCLPAGPLREQPSRLEEVDLVVVNGESMQLQPQQLYKLGSGERRGLDSLAGESVHAVAGIGNPERFFTMLSEAGVVVIPHPFPDHHQYNDGDFVSLNGEANPLPILMTEKDAVKCERLVGKIAQDIWVVPVTAVLGDALKTLLAEKIEGVKDNVG